MLGKTLNSSILVLSPRILPPFSLELGSTAKTATANFFLDKYFPNDSIKGFSQLRATGNSNSRSILLSGISAIAS